MPSDKSGAKFIAAITGAVIENFIVRVALALIPFVFVAIIALISDKQTTLQLLTILLILPVSLSIIRQFFLQRTKKDYLRVRFVLQNETSVMYVLDTKGVLKLCPDLDTASYLLYALGYTDLLPTVSQEFINTFPLQVLSSVNDWRHNRPKTPEEEQERQKQQFFQRIIEFDWNFEPKATPQKLAITVRNLSDKLLVISQAKFFCDGTKFSQGDVHQTHKRVDFYFVLGEQLSISGGETISFDLRLSKTWTTEQIERTRKEFGYFYLDCIYEGQAATNVFFKI